MQQKTRPFEPGFLKTSEKTKKDGQKPIPQSSNKKN
jgi:hypothetical protein